MSELGKGRMNNMNMYHLLREDGLCSDIVPQRSETQSLKQEEAN